MNILRGAARHWPMTVAVVLLSACQTAFEGRIDCRDATGAKRGNDQLGIDYAHCQAVRRERALSEESTRGSTPDLVGIGAPDAAFLSCMQARGWQQQRMRDD